MNTKLPFLVNRRGSSRVVCKLSGEQWRRSVRIGKVDAVRAKYRALRSDNGDLVMVGRDPITANSTSPGSGEEGADWQHLDFTGDQTYHLFVRTVANMAHLTGFHHA